MITNDEAASVRSPLAPAIAALEGATALDETAGRLSHLASRVTAGKRGSVLRGNWLGHALHPLMTDFPLGCWLSAGLLDLSCSKTYRRAAQRLVGLGVAFAVPTAITGIADYAVITDRRAKRVGVVHMLGNTGVLVFYAASWRARRRASARGSRSPPGGADGVRAPGAGCLSSPRVRSRR